MWTTIIPVLLLGLASNSVSEVDIAKLLPVDVTSQVSTTTISANLNNSVHYPATISHDENYQNISARGQTTDANIFEENGGITWNKVVNVLNSSPMGALLEEDLVAAIKMTNFSDSCRKGLEKYIDSLSKWETWSVKMADSSGKVGGGVLEGTLMSMGSYDECLRIRVVDDGGEGFRGQYCLVAYSSPIFNSVFFKNGSLNEHYLETYGEPPEWIQDFMVRSGPYLKHMALTLGTCVPSTCTDEDIKHILMQITAPLDLNIEVTGCQVDKPVNWTKGFTAAVSALSVVAVLCILGTVTDIVKRITLTDEKAVQSNSFSVRLLLMFSALSNAETLLNRKSNETFACLDGIRFFSMTWIVLSHSYDMFDTWRFLKYSNFLKIGDQFNGFVPLAVLDNAATVLGTFFFLSGFLLTYSMWKKLTKKKDEVNFFKFLFHKYWRLTPGLALTLAVFVVVAGLGSGPLWTTTIDPVMERCHQGWWKNMLYISNWWNHDETCLMHTWYVGCLLQLHVVGFLLIHLTIRWPVLGVSVGLALFFGCMALVALLVIWNRMPLPALFTQRDFDVGMIVAGWLRYRPYYYIHSYLIGMLVGYLILKYKDKKIKPRYQVVAWVLSACGSLYAVYGIYGPGNGAVVTTFFFAVHFVAWSGSLGWLTYACIAGYGGILNRFLSWKAFSLLSTTSYLVYLLHFIICYYTPASTRQLINYGHYEIVCLFLSNLVISYFLAFVGHVTVEMPFTHLERFIF